MIKRDVERFKKHFSERAIFVSLIGSSETGAMRRYLIDKNTQLDGSVVPVGYPIDGRVARRFYVYDRLVIFHALTLPAFKRQPNSNLRRTN